MVLDPKKHADWEIAQDAETRMKSVYEIGRDLGLLEKELLPYGHMMGKVDYRAALDAGSLRGARIGVMRFLLDGYSAETRAAFEQSLTALRAAGAQLVAITEAPATSST